MPMLDLLWAIVMVVALIVVLWLAITVGLDVLRSDDLSGFAKAAWILLLILLPLLGALIYLVARGDSMGARARRRERRLDVAERRRIDEATGTATEDDVAALRDLHDRGVISDEDLHDQEHQLGASDGS